MNKGHKIIEVDADGEFVRELSGDNSNLKLALMELGNKLVTQHRFDPSHQQIAKKTVDSVSFRSTTMIAAFTEWLNNVPEAQEVLKELDFDWPVVTARLDNES